MSESVRIACDVSPDFYKRFKILKAKSGAKTNTDFLSDLLDLYEGFMIQNPSLDKEKEKRGKHLPAISQ